VAQLFSDFTLSDNIKSQILNRELNEDEVKHSFVSPLIHSLGYGVDEETYCYLERKLTYPYYYIGHKGKKDLPIGFPDYRCGLHKRRGSFIVEAKSSNIDLTEADIEQAHSYAAHADVSANLFIVTNGILTRIYETLGLKPFQAIFEFQIDQINEIMPRIRGILLPAALQRNFSNFKLTSNPISSLIGKDCRLVDAKYSVDHLELSATCANPIVQNLILSQLKSAEQNTKLNMIKQLNHRVSKGKVFRDVQSGQLCVEIIFDALWKDGQQNLKVLDFEKIFLYSDDLILSEDEQNPTIFEFNEMRLTEKGSQVFELFGPAQSIQFDIGLKIIINILVHHNEDGVHGEYAVFSQYNFATPQTGSVTIDFDMYGELDAGIA
jgi:Type I restriction enzyme R protein N terminus (HSDR_N)